MNPSELNETFGARGAVMMKCEICGVPVDEDAIEGPHVAYAGHYFGHYLCGKCSRRVARFVRRSKPHNVAHLFWSWALSLAIIGFLMGGAFYFAAQHAEPVVPRVLIFLLCSGASLFIATRPEP